MGLLELALAHLELEFYVLDYLRQFHSSVGATHGLERIV